MQVLVLLFLFSSLTAAVFNAESYDFGAEKAFKKLCQSPKDWFCSALTVEDFTPKRISLLFRGWYEMRRGMEGELLPLLKEIAEELRSLKGRLEELEALKSVMENELTWMVVDFICLLVVGRSFELAADLLAELQQDFNLPTSQILLGKSGSSEFAAIVGVKHAHLIVGVIDQDFWNLQPHLAAAIFNDRTGKLLKSELNRIEKSREQLKLLSLFFCWPIVGSDPQHLKQLRSTIKTFAQDLKEEDFKTELIAQSDLCYGEDVKVALKQLKLIESASIQGRERIIQAGLQSNNFAISWAVAEQVLGTQLISFLEKVKNLKAVWPFVKEALVELRFSYKGDPDKNGIIMAVMEHVLNSGRAEEFKSFLLLAVNEVNNPQQPIQFCGRNRQKYNVQVRRLDGLLVLLYDEEIKSALCWMSYRIISFNVKSSIFAELALEDRELATSIGRFESSQFDLERMENMFNYLGRHDQFAQVLEKLLKCSKFSDAKAFVLEQVSKLYRQYHYSYLIHPVESFILTNRPLISFIRYRWGNEAIAQLPQEVLKLLPKFEL